MARADFPIDDMDEKKIQEAQEAAEQAERERERLLAAERERWGRRK